MSSYTSPLKLRPSSYIWNGRPVFIVEAAFVYMVGDRYSPVSVTVAKGSLTDFASVPLTGDTPLVRLLQRIPLVKNALRWWTKEFTPEGSYRKAAILHDTLYTLGYKGKRHLADKIFWEAMKVVDDKYGRTKLWKRQCMYWAVRLAGWRSYGRKMEGQKQMRAALESSRGRRT